MSLPTVTLVYDPARGIGIKRELAELATAEMMLLVALSQVQRELLALAVNDARQKGLVIPRGPVPGLGR